MRWRCCPGSTGTGCCRTPCRTGREAYERRAFDERLPRTADKRADWVQQIGEDGHHLLTALAAPTALRLAPSSSRAAMLRRSGSSSSIWQTAKCSWRTRAGRDPAGGAAHQLALRCRCPLCLQGQHDVDRLQGAPDRDLRRQTCRGSSPTVQTTAGPSLTAMSWHRSTMTSEARACFPRSTSSTRATSVPLCWWKHSATSGSTWLALPVPTSLAVAGRQGLRHGRLHRRLGRQRVTCPMGAQSSGWSPAIDNRDTPVIKVKFSTKDCRACAHRVDCAGPNATRRLMTFRTRDAVHRLAGSSTAADNARIHQPLRYTCRNRGHHLPGRPRLRAPTIPLLRHAKTHLQHVAMAAAMNLCALFAGSTETISLPLGSRTSRT